MNKAVQWRLIRMMMVPVLFLFLAVFAPGASAESVKDFYKGKRMTLLVQYSPGGSFDVQARWLGRQLPGITTACPYANQRFPSSPLSRSG